MTIDRDAIIKNFVEVQFEKDDDFRKVKETLTRIGIASWNKRRLIQSCHILHKQGRYYLLHFKELFMLDNRPTDFTEEDIARRNTVANMLHEWGMFKLLDPVKSSAPVLSNKNLVVLSHNESKDWDLVAKYNIGKKKR